MLKKKVEGEEKIFAELRKSLWELCFFQKKNLISKNHIENQSIFDCKNKNQTAHCEQSDKQKEKNMQEMKKEIKKDTVTLRMDTKLWKQWKAYCLLKGKGMSDDIIDFIRTTLFKEKIFELIDTYASSGLEKNEDDCSDSFDGTIDTEQLIKLHKSLTNNKRR